MDIAAIDCMFAGVTELGLKHPTISVFHLLSLLYQECNTPMIHNIVELSIHCAVKRM